VAGGAAMITLVGARAVNGVIGARGAIPWKLASDMKEFVAYTRGKPVLMGRKTWASLQRRPLPGRANIVLTRAGDFRAAGGWTMTDFATAMACAQAMAQGEVCVIGGAEIYALALRSADRVRLTEVALSPAGDAVFPDLDPAEWEELSREERTANAGDDADFVVRIMARR